MDRYLISYILFIGLFVVLDARIDSFYLQHAADILSEVYEIVAQTLVCAV